MRLVRFNRNVELPSLARLGCVLDGDRVVDLRAAYIRYLTEQADDPQAREIGALRMPPAISAFLQLGAVGRRALDETLPWVARLALAESAATGIAGEVLFTPLAECRLHAPVRLTKLIVVRATIGGRDASPSIVMKPIGTVVGPTRGVVWPGDPRALRFAAGLAVVIGRRCKSIAETEAMGVIAGYTVMSDIRVDAGRDADNPFTAGMFESFAPSGPWLMVPDGAVNPAGWRITAHVNDHTVQDYAIGDLSWSLERTISYLSRMGFDPGDTVWLGSGEHLAKKTELQLGDALFAAVSAIGSIRNSIVAD